MLDLSKLKVGSLIRIRGTARKFVVIKLEPFYNAGVNCSLFCLSCLGKIYCDKTFGKFENNWEIIR